MPTPLSYYVEFSHGRNPSQLFTSSPSGEFDRVSNLLFLEFAVHFQLRQGTRPASLIPYKVAPIAEEQKSSPLS
jgi:hypothetical protein